MATGRTVPRRDLENQDGPPDGFCPARSDRSRSPMDRRPPGAMRDDDPVLPSSKDPNALQNWSDATEVGDGELPSAVTFSPPQNPPVTPPPDMEGVEDGKDPFTLVTYRKNRAKGIPVVFKPLQENLSFWKVNPNTVAKEICSAAQEEILSHRFNRDGSICVCVTSEGAVANLMGLKTVAGLDVAVIIPSSYLNNMGKIYDVPLDYEDEDIASYLAEEGVTSARRQRRHVYTEGGLDYYTPLKSVILTFKSNMKLPKTLRLGFNTYEVSEYVEGPVQCYKCQRFGHLARSCRGSTRCMICARPHKFTECTARRQPKCANCGGPHAASHSMCPKKRVATVAHQTEVLNPTSPSPPNGSSRRGQQRRVGASRPNPYPEPPKNARVNVMLAKRTPRQLTTVQAATSVPDEQVHGPPSNGGVNSRPQVCPTYAGVAGRTSSVGNKSPPMYQRSEPERRVDTNGLADLLLPLIFAALKAILQTFPSSSELSAVKQLLATERFLASYQTPILAISEAYVKDDFRLSGYHIVRSGGAASSRTILCVRSDLTFAVQPRTPGIAVDYVTCVVRFRDVLLTVVSLYVPPSSALTKREVKHLLENLPPPFILVGDINAHHPLWGSRKTDAKGRIWSDVIDELDVCLLNDGSSTFMRRDFTTDVLDVSICSKDVFRKASWSTDCDGRGSDHLPIYIAIRGCTIQRGNRSVRLVNWKVFRERCEVSSQREMTADHFSEVLTTSLRESSRHVPVAAGHTGSSPQVEQLRACRRRAERRARRTGLLSDIVAARHSLRAVQHRLRALDRQRWRRFCETLSPFSRPARIWQVARSLRDGLPRTNPLGSLALILDKSEVDVALDFCGTVAAAAEAAGTATFHTYMVELREDLDRITLPSNAQLDADFSLPELKTALRLSRPKSSPGVDGITYSALRNLGAGGLRTLLFICNSSWRSGQVPASWKEAMVVPLLKPGKHPSHLSSFRPVSLTSCVGKVMERMVLHRLEWWLERNHVFPDEMAGFRRHRSSVDSLMDLVTAVEVAKSCKRIVEAVFLDVKRAYDTRDDRLKSNSHLAGSSGSETYP
ncbi:uncharacterized protein LOC135384740 [Ornithodoros turicata]|uniref:uncharacterized protein LOC135384740 n=1 Tax=Ornithodoros turicata TaxID=34597 RepID=UPI0031388EC7